MRQPEIAGEFGRAWEIRNDGRDTRPDAQGMLAGYLVYCPGAHPFWNQWILSAIHLRDIPGVKPAHKTVPENTHEFLIMALNPETHKTPDPDAWPFDYLVPADLVHQVAGLTDEDARALCRRMVETIVVHGMSPDQDYRRWWQDALDREVRRYIEGDRR